MAPMDIVYECEEAPKKNPVSIALGVVTVVLCIYGAIGMPLLLMGVDVPRFADLLSLFG